MKVYLDLSGGTFLVDSVFSSLKCSVRSRPCPAPLLPSNPCDPNPDQDFLPGPSWGPRFAPVGPRMGPVWALLHHLWPFVGLLAGPCEEVLGRACEVLEQPKVAQTRAKSELPGSRGVTREVCIRATFDLFVAPNGFDCKSLGACGVSKRPKLVSKRAKIMPLSTPKWSGVLFLRGKNVVLTPIWTRFWVGVQPRGRTQREAVEESGGGNPGPGVCLGICKGWGGHT